MQTVVVEDNGPAVRAVVRLPGCTAGQGLEAFTNPELLARWWGNAVLTADLVPGGRYDVFFAGIPARMTGQVVRYEPGRELAFSWGWEHEPDEPRRMVSVTAGSGDDGSAELVIVHGPHADDEAGRAARQGHREGWEHFLPRLHAVFAG